MIGTQGLQAICTIQAAFAKIDTEGASATEKADAKVIKGIIEELPQGFNTLNRIIRDKLSALIINTLAKGNGMANMITQNQDVDILRVQLKAQESEIADLKRRLDQASSMAYRYLGRAMQSTRNNGSNN